MIKLDIVDYDRFGQVMQKFRPLIKKSGIVLISFNDEVIGIAKSRPFRQILGNPTDQKTGIAISTFEYPREQ